MMMLDASHGISYEFQCYIIHHASRLVYRDWYSLHGLYMCPIQVHTVRLLAVFLIIWTHIHPFYTGIHTQLSDYTGGFLILYIGSILCIYFYLWGCVSNLYLELDLLDHCGTFAIGFLVKNHTR